MLSFARASTSSFRQRRQLSIVDHFGKIPGMSSIGEKQSVIDLPFKFGYVLALLGID
jgi:hypothetical protein